MDNITHSLVGVALSAVAVKVVPKAAAKTSLIVWTAILSNNAPDIDVVIPMIFHGGRLMALLQHRGFTHTVLAAPFLSVIVLFFAWLFSLCPKIDLKWFLGLFGLSIIGVLMHLGADYCNDYGVHPFSPFNNQWYYGDFIFIIEPLIWFAILPLAYFSSRKWILKILVLILYAAMAGLLLFGPYAPAYVFVGASLFAVTAWYLQKWLKDGVWSAVPAWVLIALILACFHHGSQTVKSDIEKLLTENRPGEKVIQFARTPAPADPFCWKALLITEGPGDQYTIRSASVSLLPRWIKSSSCLQGLDGAHSVQLAPVSLPVRDGALESASFEVSWLGEFKRELSEIGRLSKEFCQFRSLRQFARAPFWSNDEEGWYAGDFRYDRGSSHGFSSVRFATSGNDTECPGEFPPGFSGWVPPVPTE